MGFFRSHFGRNNHSDNQSPAGSSSWSGQRPSSNLPSNIHNPGAASTDNDKLRDEEYLPPPYPPPSHQNARHPGPPLSYVHGDVTEDFAPPAGPPPSHIPVNLPEEEYAPPPGSPPAHTRQAEPVAHDWQSAVPDTSLLPPPPVLSSDFSPNSNADSSDARRAWDWCKANELFSPRQPDLALFRRSKAGELPLQGPSAKYPGNLKELEPGVWQGTTKKGAADQCFLTSIPLYFALGPDSPKMTEQPKTVYFELHFTARGLPDREGNEASLAVGFAAAPYPTWRMPGWERGSVAVHADDGRRYVNNQDGGQDFVVPFAPNVVVGLGLSYWVESSGLVGEAFFTRNGKLEDKWSLQEEMDASSEYGIWGLAGDHDLYGAVGTFGEVGFKAVFKPEKWAYSPPQIVGRLDEKSGKGAPPEYSR